MVIDAIRRACEFMRRNRIGVDKTPIDYGAWAHTEVRRKGTSRTSPDALCALCYQHGWRSTATEGAFWAHIQDDVNEVHMSEPLPYCRTCFGNLASRRLYCAYDSARLQFMRLRNGAKESVPQARRIFREEILAQANGK